MKIAKTVGGFFFLKQHEKKKKIGIIYKGFSFMEDARTEKKKRKKKLDPCSVVGMTEKTIEEFR